MSAGSNGRQITRTTISRAESFKAVHWLEAQADQIKQLTRQETCDELGKHLGTPVTVNTLVALYRDIGKEFPGKISRRPPSKRFDRPRFLARQLLALNARLEYLAEQMGEDCPDCDFDADAVKRVADSI